MSHPLEPRIAAYIAAQMPDATDVAVSGLSRISGGASRETYRFVGSWNQGGQAREQKLILRRDPPASLIDTERRIEFEAYRAFHGTSVPAPRMLWLEEGDGPLDHPFFIAEEIAGFQAGPGLPDHHERRPVGRRLQPGQGALSHQGGPRTYSSGGHRQILHPDGSTPDCAIPGGPGRVP